MYLTERHIIRKSHRFYGECDSLCFQSKNIYNQGLYNIRQHFFKTGKYLSYVECYGLTKQQECYSYLPTKVFCQTLKKLDKNFLSFFRLLKNKTVKNRLPKYLDKSDGRFITVFPKQALGKKIFDKEGKVNLSQTKIKLNTRVGNYSDLKEVRIVPRLDHYIIEVVYKVKTKEWFDNGNVAGIDLGLNNLATVGFNNGYKPLVINGKPLKSINQFYNKKRASLQSRLPQGRKTSKNIRRLTLKRNFKVDNFLHKASKLLVNQLVSKGVTTLVIGKNDNMKQDINMGRVNNQNFTQVPIVKFAELVKYKCEIQGVKVLFQEENYTSKCSFLDQEEICKHQEYLGRRVRRGLFKTKGGTLINADVNGAYNIMRKAIPKAFAKGIEGVGVHPLRLQVV